jgi:phosphate:Na+ symporter
MLLMQFSPSRNYRSIGQVILSIGLLFFGVGVIKSAASGSFSPDLITLLKIAENYPVGLAIFAAVMSFLLQSSTATIGLVMSLAVAGSSMNLALALPVVCGANIGIAITTLMVGYRRVESRRLGLANLLAKLLTAAILLGLLQWIIPWLSRTPGDLGQQVANTHTGFNILKALLVLPLIRPLSSLVEMWIPAPAAGDRQAFGPRYIQHGPFDGATLAMAQSAREIMFAAEIVRSMLEDLWRAMKSNDEDLVRQISERDNQVDLLDAEIKKFLARLPAQHLDADELQEQLRQLRYLAELESIGDIIDKNLCRIVKKKIKLRLDFSSETWQELDDFDKKVLENMLLADTAFQTRDRELAEKLLRHKDHIDLQIRQLRDAHFARFTADTEAQYETSAIQLDLLTNLKRINSHVSHVAYAVIHGCDYPTATAPSNAAT